VTVYADSSAIVKLYVREPESDQFLAVVHSAGPLASSIVAYTEVRAGLARAERLLRHTTDEHAAAVKNFEDEWAEVIKVEIGDALVRQAGALAEQHVLRGFDAIHLASALTLQRELGQPILFSAFDSRLTTAAAACGLSLA
jgi:uncharacterized protein